MLDGRLLWAQSRAAHIFTVIETSICAGSSVHLKCSLTNSPFTSNFKLSPGCWLTSQPALRGNFETYRSIFGSWQSLTVPLVKLACQSRCLPGGHHCSSQTLHMLIA